jgi:YgiT-type zinc finger domain-containing protein
MTNELKRCDICRIGHCQSVKAPYLYWVDDQVMVMPNSPAWACDICGQVYFEPTFLVRIERLLQELESSVESRRATQRVIQREEADSWHPSRSGR